MGLFLVALLEVLPPLGRFLPGQLLVGLLAALAVALDAASAWILVATLAGTLLGDVLNFVRAKHHPRFLMGGAGGWWLPGQDVDRLEAGLRRNPVRTFLVRRFFTKDRALLPLAAGGWNMAWSTFLLAAGTACVAWSLTWLTLGAATAYAMMHLPPAIGIAMLFISLLLATRPVDTPRPDAR